MKAVFTTQEIAPELGVTEFQLRGWLREAYWSSAPGKGGRWSLTIDMVVAAARHFA